MADLGGVFNPDEHESNKSFDLLPVGEYLAHITESDLTDTKAKNGKILNLTVEILDGQYKGRKVWDRLNIQNPSEKAQAIGLGKFKSICEAIKSGPVRDSSQVHNKALVVKLGVKPAEGQYEAQNIIKEYKPVNGVAQTQAAHAPVAPVSRASWRNRPTV